MVLKTIIIALTLLSGIRDTEPVLYSMTRKRADKILAKYWSDSEYRLSHLKLSGPYQPELYAVQQGNSKPFSYVLFDEARSKVESFVYLVIFKPDGTIEMVSVLLYKENYGGEIASKRFLKQFAGKSNGQNMEFNKDIDGISGATISAQSITLALKRNSIKFKQLIEQLQ
jgi:Na+-translocating ferredoxin:NAD+ oxidoreductase RnfG subunit